jgi:hypothetical protein
MIQLLPHSHFVLLVSSVLQLLCFELPLRCCLLLKHALLDVSNSFARVQVLRACLTAVHDSVAPVQLEGII